MASLILEPSELRLLEQLRINPVKSFPGKVRGERVTRRTGVSIEFADYREYSEGDDLRHLDWNVLARLDAPIMKTYRDEEDLAVHILLDFSPSMEFGEPTKAAQALRLAAAFCWASICGGDAVYPLALGVPQQPSGALRGRSGYTRFCRWAASVSPAKPGSLASSLRAFAGGKARPGLCIILSDGLDPEAPSAMRVLAGRGHEVALIQILSPLDLDPDLEGDLRLIDAETQSAVEITANSITLREYRSRLLEHNSALSASAIRGGGRAEIVRSDQPLVEVINKQLVPRGWLQT